MSKSFLDVSPIFVVGSGRSGTTMLQLMLNAHPKIAMQGELHFFEDVLALKDEWATLSDDEDLANFFRKIPELHSLKYLPQLEKYLELTHQRMKEGGRSYEDFHRYMMEVYAQQKGATRLGEKTPSNVRYMEQLLAMYPNACIIHIIRDPRAVVASMIKVPFTGNDVLSNVIKWKLDIEYSQRMKTEHASNYIEVRYEDLVSDPTLTLKNICEFIGEPYSEDMLGFYMTASSYTNTESWKEGTTKAVHEASVDKWRSELAPSQVYIIEKIAGRLLGKVGYPRAHAPLRAKWMSPVTLGVELMKYARYKAGTIKRRRTENSGEVVGSSHSFYKRCLRGIWR